jgi:hypothetical protein
VVLWNPSYSFEYYGNVKGAKVNEIDGTMAVIPNYEAKAFKSYGAYVLMREKRLKLKPKKKPMSKIQQMINEKFAKEMQIKVTPLVGGGKDLIRVLQLTQCTMSAEVVLFHELGHVKQYFESGGEANWAGRISNADNTAKVEADNLARHENLMSKECGLSIRAHYKHSVKGFEEVIKGYERGEGWKLKALRITDNMVAREKDDKLLASKANDSGEIKEEDLVVSPDHC